MRNAGRDSAKISRRHQIVSAKNCKLTKTWIGTPKSCSAIISVHVREAENAYQQASPFCCCIHEPRPPEKHFSAAMSAEHREISSPYVCDPGTIPGGIQGKKGGKKPSYVLHYFWLQIRAGPSMRPTEAIASGSSVVETLSVTTVSN